MQHRNLGITKSSIIVITHDREYRIESFDQRWESCRYPPLQPTIATVSGFDSLLVSWFTYILAKDSVYNWMTSYKYTLSLNLIYYHSCAACHKV